jgi:hypothetical protein
VAETVQHAQHTHSTGELRRGPQCCCVSDTVKKLQGEVDRLAHQQAALTESKAGGVG